MPNRRCETCACYDKETKWTEQVELTGMTRFPQFGERDLGYMCRRYPKPIGTSPDYWCMEYVHIVRD